MSTVCKYRHRGDKGGRAWCEPPTPEDRRAGPPSQIASPRKQQRSRCSMYCWITAFLLELLLLEAPSTNSDDQDPPVAESRSARSSPARGATGSPTTPRTRAGRAAQLGSAPSCGAASVVGTQHQRRHSPTWNCAQVLALPGAAGMATMQRKLAGKKQGVGGFLLTATIGDNYLCQPHDGATRGGARPAVAATASCPTPHATVRGTLPCSRLTRLLTHLGLSHCHTHLSRVPSS
uniref:Uncharacterized protein LOC116941166 isoform X1 n=1 Tax=Petromyzon marinus TaxID=7757 RepID=A0AAJ7T0B4_PETMA|nr:uncharacterized protein LOC116941166 isoform X1 [Petromyzon marinus]